jgi:hypothetical protein
MHLKQFSAKLPSLWVVCYATSVLLGPSALSPEKNWTEPRSKATARWQGL